MESVGDLIIVVNDILPFLANVYLYSQRKRLNSEHHINII
jgi:hypothetical protein